MKEYECVQVSHHKNIGEVVEEYQGKGWHLHTYACAAPYLAGGPVNHYLLFERGS